MLLESADESEEKLEFIRSRSDGFHNVNCLSICLFWHPYCRWPNLTSATNPNRYITQDIHSPMPWWNRNNRASGRRGARRCTRRYKVCRGDRWAGRGGSPTISQMFLLDFGKKLSGLRHVKRLKHFKINWNVTTHPSLLRGPLFYTVDSGLESNKREPSAPNKDRGHLLTFWTEMKQQ